MGEVQRVKRSADKVDVRNIFIICALVFFITFLICPYSPYYRYVYSYDEVCYKTIVKGIFDGRLPYRDLFDHKGPLTYLIFAAGYLLAGKHDLGMWIISAAIDAVGFVFAYKTSALRLKKNEALLSSVFLIFIISFYIEGYNINVFATGSKPDNFVFTFLMISTYLFIKETCFTSKEHMVSNKTMYLIGLLCGGVFLIKLNVCLIYLAFVGCYFLWLIIRKKSKAFIGNCGVFLGGLLTISIPFLIYFLLTGSLRDFIDIYFVFNGRYATDHSEFFLVDGLPYWVSRISFSILLVLTLLAFIHDIRKGKKRLQLAIMGALFLIVFFALTTTKVFPYFFIIFMIFLVYGTDLFAQILCSILEKRISSFKISVVVIAVSVVFMGLGAYFYPHVPFKKTEYEKKIEQFAKERPDADYLFFGLCFPIYDEYLEAGPAVKQFYIPNYVSDDMYDESLLKISRKEVDVVVCPLIIGYERETDYEVIDAFCNNGYSIYQKYKTDDGVYMVYMLVSDQT